MRTKDQVIKDELDALIKTIASLKAENEEHKAEVLRLRYSLCDSTASNSKLMEELQAHVDRV